MNKTNFKDSVTKTFTQVSTFLSGVGYTCCLKSHTGGTEVITEELLLKVSQDYTGTTKSSEQPNTNIN